MPAISRSQAHLSRAISATLNIVYKKQQRHRKGASEAKSRKVQNVEEKEELPLERFTRKRPHPLHHARRREK